MDINTIFESTADKISDILYNNDDIKVFPTDYGTGIKAIIPTVSNIYNKKYYIELISESRMDYIPKKLDFGYTEDDVLYFEGIKICEITKTNDNKNVMNGEIIHIDRFITFIKKEKNKNNIIKKLESLKMYSNLNEESISKINDVWFGRNPGTKTLAVEYIYN